MQMLPATVKESMPQEELIRGTQKLFQCLDL